MSRFTEGEWMVMRDHPNTVQVARGNKGGFVVIDTPQETQEADARLISAAKEMYEALDQCHCMDYEYYGLPRDLTAKIDAAIAKARGQA